jgi:hypothetical protein
VVNAVLLKPFAYPDADQIMYLSQYDLKQSVDTASVTYPNFLDWQKQQTSFTHLAAARTQTFNLTGVAEPVHVNGAMISPEAFPLFALRRPRSAARAGRHKMHGVLSVFFSLLIA